MANILAVGDIHMKADLILPTLDNVLSKHQEIDQIVFTGDYFDEWGQNDYIETAESLSKWILEKRKSYKVICLIGNHDAPYLSGVARHYSNQSPLIADQLREEMIHNFRVQFAYMADNWLFVHGGAVGEIKLDSSYFQPLEDDDFSRRMAFQEDMIIAPARGGTSPVGGIIWCDYDAELLIHGSKTYPKQIVGHSPQETISAIVPKPEERPEECFIGIDTFSLTANHRPIGDGSLLLLKNGQPHIIQTSYCQKVKEKYKKLG